MEKTAPPNTLAVNGEPLRQAREARGLSVQDMAGAVTLSREQVRALEDGGNAPFYTAAHKRLALKKYAAALHIPLSELIVNAGDAALPVPANIDAEVPASGVSGLPADIRMAAAERNARLRRQLLIAAFGLAVMLAFYAKQRGRMDVAPPPESIEASVADELSALESLPDPAEATPEADAGSPLPAVADAAEAPAMIATAEAPACALPPAAEVPEWSPPYQRKPDARLFLVSSRPVDLCIADVSGKPSLIALKPNAGQVFAGKPPYLVKADGLGAVEIYLQGMRVRAPSDATALRLVPSRATRPDEVASSGPAE